MAYHGMVTMDFFTKMGHSLGQQIEPSCWMSRIPFPASSTGPLRPFLLQFVTADGVFYDTWNGSEHSRDCLKNWEESVYPLVICHITMDNYGKIQFFYGKTHKSKSQDLISWKSSAPPGTQGRQGRQRRQRSRRLGMPGFFWRWMVNIHVNTR